MQTEAEIQRVHYHGDVLVREGQESPEIDEDRPRVPRLGRSVGGARYRLCRGLLQLQEADLSGTRVDVDVAASTLDWATTVATVALALFTGALFWVTYRLANQGRRDAEARWRPLLLLSTIERIKIHSPGYSSNAFDVWSEGEDNYLRAWIRNSGTGPAMKTVARALGQDVVLDIIATDDDAAALFNGLSLPHGQGFTLHLSYLDLAGRSFATQFQCERDRNGIWQIGSTTVKP